jgi:ABC-type Fe3+/spermidine/putrescine transport system ATPase subunit
MALVRLKGLEGRYPHQISGGQAQRVALARALVNEPEVLLLDEPLSALDRKIRQQMQEELRQIQATVGTTFIYVTHDQDEAMAMSTRVVLLCDGAIAQIASPQALYAAPTTEFAANFIGDANLLEGTVVESAGGPAVAWNGLRLPGLPATGLHAGDQVRLMVRPEAIHLLRERPEGSDALAEGRVEQSSFFGFYWNHRVRVGEQLLLVREVGSAAPPSAQATVWLAIDGSRAAIIP